MSLDNQEEEEGSFWNSKEYDLAKLQGQKEKCFSIGGKEVPLKVITQVVPTYAMTVFLLPTGLYQEIKKISAYFWWGSRGEGNRL